MTYTVSQGLSVVSAVEASYSDAWAAYYPLIQKRPALSSSKLMEVHTRLERMNPTSMIRIGDDVMGGIVRAAFGAAKGNLVMAKEILAGPNAASHMQSVTELIDTAKTAIRSLVALAGSVRTLNDWSASNPTRSASSLVQVNGFGSDLGFIDVPLWVAGLVLVAGIVILVVGVSVLIDTLQRTQNAEIALQVAREACERARERGRPCTPADFQQAYERAARAQQEISPPLLSHRPGESPIDNLNDVIFWGGLLAVTVVLGYGIWTTLPAAQSFRSRHQKPLRWEVVSLPPDRTIPALPSRATLSTSFREKLR